MPSDQKIEIKGLTQSSNVSFHFFTDPSGRYRRPEFGSETTFWESDISSETREDQVCDFNFSDAFEIINLLQRESTNIRITNGNLKIEVPMTDQKVASSDSENDCEDPNSVRIFFL